MKASSYIRKLAWINILKKKQRTRLSLTAVCLSTAIIFTSLILFKNVRDFSSKTDYNDVGDYHYAFYTSEEVKLIGSYDYSLDHDTGYYGNYQNKAFNLRVLTLNYSEKPALPFILSNGNYPENEDEILVSDSWHLSVGDTVDLDLAKTSEKNEDDSFYHFLAQEDNARTSSRTFKVSGIYHENEVFQSLTNQTSLCYTVLPTLNGSVFYIRDKQIQSENSLGRLGDKLQIEKQQIYSNSDVISADVVKSYLQDTTMLLIIFMIILLVSITMSLISVHNVVIISDKSRRKELGLLKSIGASPIDIEQLLKIELVSIGIIGAVLGIILGAATSYAILNAFIDRLYISFDSAMILDPVIIFVSLMSGICLMYVSGMKAYHQYIGSTAISDLKENSYEYPEPMDKKDEVIETGFAWKMFIIYNGRMKHQTRNILYSFILLLVTTVLFVSVALSNKIYNNRFSSKNYDFEVTNQNKPLELERKLITTDPEVSRLIYQEVDQGQFDIISIYAQRMLSNGFRTRIDAYDAYVLESYIRHPDIPYVDGYDANHERWVNVYNYATALDAVQLKELEPYIVDGSFDNFGVIAVFNASERMGAQFCSGFKVGTEVASEQLLDKEIKLSSKYLSPQEISAVVHVPESVLNQLHMDYRDYPRVLAYSLESLGIGIGISERITIDLKNPSAAMDLQDTVDHILYETGHSHDYFYTNIVLEKETSRFAVFMIEVLLYPLFLMLFIVSLMNIHNVFMGNVHLKRNDISIMKSVGMTNRQLRKLFGFEYIEGYFNASVCTMLIFIPFSILSSQISFASSLDIGTNMIGTLFVALMFLGIILVIPLVIMSLHHVQRILPIENLKDVD